MFIALSIIRKKVDTIKMMKYYRQNKSYQKRFRNKPNKNEKKKLKDKVFIVIKSFNKSDIFASTVETLIKCTLNH